MEAGAMDWFGDMLSRSWVFAKRHKKKLIAATVVGVIGGTVAYTAHNFRRKLKELEDLMPAPTQKLDEEQLSVLRMQVHLQTSMSDSERAVRTHLEELHAKIAAQVDLEAITEKLRILKQSGHKGRERQQLWEELKLASFTRVITAIYALCTLHLVVHVQLTLLARHTYRRSAANVFSDDGTQTNPIPELSDKAKLHLLAVLSHLNTDGLAYLASTVHAAVNVNVDRSLKGKMSASDLERIIARICRSVDGQPPSNDWSSSGNTTTTSPPLDLSSVLLPEYLRNPTPESIRSHVAGLDQLPESERVVVNTLLTELAAVCSGPAFASVLDGLVSTVSEFVICNTFRATEETTAAAPSSGGAMDSSMLSTVSSSPSIPDESSESPTLGSSTSASSSVPLSPIVPSTAVTVQSNHKSKVILRLRQVVRCMFYQEGELVWQLSSSPGMKELCTIIFTSEAPSY